MTGGNKQNLVFLAENKVFTVGHAFSNDMGKFRFIHWFSLP